MSRVAKERASRLREFKDAHQEYKETGSRDALERRNRAMRSGSPEDFGRAGTELAKEAHQEKTDRKQRLKEMEFRPRRGRR